MGDSSQLSATLEDYLEAISRIISKSRVARVRDIAAAVGVHNSTVTAALKSLSEKGLVDYSPYEVTTLTASGRRAANEIVRRHRLIREFLTEVLLVDEEVADANACRMEHVMDKQVLERLTVFAQLAQQTRGNGEEIFSNLLDHLQRGGKSQKRTLVRHQRKADSKKTVLAEKKGA